ncbi:hypothetical protein EYF80_045061 [Liparis tanakae]|uniref:Uncharacterized protein n=1 Tax=Liparis tanakae TaxID=230148 RepID=A0A4Z2FUS0_9TELE|nr:hypothetical protein EYF80_045061 [Liparis tanakae]
MKPRKLPKRRVNEAEKLYKHSAEAALCSLAVQNTTTCRLPTVINMFLRCSSRIELGKLLKVSPLWDE